MFSLFTETIEYPDSDILLDGLKPFIFYEYVGSYFLSGYINLIKDKQYFLLKRYQENWTEEGHRYVAGFFL